MPANVSFEYSNAEKKYLAAGTDEEKLLALEEMLKFMPKHKSGEALRANIKARYKKFREDLEKKRQQKKKQGKKEGIKKEGVQVVLIGLTNSGKSSLISILTNAKPEISQYPFTTKTPVIGALNYDGIKFQIIDMPAINYETFQQGTANTADILLIVITDVQDMEKISLFLEKSAGKRIIVFNKSDLLTPEYKRKIDARLKSKRYNFVRVSCRTEEGIDKLKEKLLENSGIIRIYTKQPGKQTDKEPVMMPQETSIQNVAEKIFHKNIKIKEVRVTGPSSKFPNQLVGPRHKLKDKDIVEFHTG